MKLREDPEITRFFKNKAKFVNFCMKLVVSPFSESYSEEAKCIEQKIYIGHNFLKIPGKIPDIRASYCTWSFLVTRSFYWYQNICPNAILAFVGIGHYWGHCVSQTRLVSSLN